MNKMKELNSLKNRLLGPGKNNQITEIDELCAIMELVGGYSELLELPLTSLKGIRHYLKLKNTKK